MRLKIAIVVHGRFHAFDLARELLRLGHDVTLFTNYPAFAAARFGVPGDHVRSCWVHGVGSRVIRRLCSGGWSGRVERITNQAFGQWAARQVVKENWNVVIAFSGVAEETFAALSSARTLKVLQRGSAHIRVQAQLLEEEGHRSGKWIDKPSPWIMDREEREYAMADIIHVLSRFAGETFIAQGVDPEKLYVLPLGACTQSFRASASVIESRCARIVGGEPLRILNVGTFCMRKGMADVTEAIQRLAKEPMRFRFVGPVGFDGRFLQKRLRGLAEFREKRPQHQLAEEYAWGDLFLLSTIEDGFAVVLAQALAAGLPLITSPNCAGPDLIREGETGWIIPIRRPDRIVDLLRWCNEHRAEAAQMVRNAWEMSALVDWSQTGSRAEANILEALTKRQATSLTFRCAAAAA